MKYRGKNYRSEKEKVEKNRCRQGSQIHLEIAESNIRIRFCWNIRYRFIKKKDSGRNDRSLLFRNLY